MIINGDAANRDGKPQEYANIKNILTPLSEADIPVYITMGNHDRRDTFFAAFPDYKKESPFVNGRHIDIIETPHTYLFLLDTLEVVNNTPGILGTHQREWLTETLSSHNDKPVILIGHQYPWANIQNGNWRGLKDYAELLENFPNPVHSKTVISYELAITSPVLLQVFNSDGRLIKTLVQKEKQNAGFHKVNFDAAGLPDGAYVYRLNIGGKVLADNMFITK